MKTAIKKAATTAPKMVVKKAKPAKGSLEAVLKAMDNLRKQNVDFSYLKPDYE